jgi:hypothetical protein
VCDPKCHHEMHALAGPYSGRKGDPMMPMPVLARITRTTMFTSIAFHLMNSIFLL